MMDKQKAPLFERLVEHAGSKHISLHVPGHKAGQGLAASARPYYEAILQLDATEITGLDDLHHPEEAILEAQQLAADCFGAEESFFLVNGSTVGNLAMILSVCRRGELLLVQRDVHKSVIHGLMLAGAKAVFLNPEVDSETGLTLGLRPDAVEQALEKYPAAKGLLLTRPGYYGTAVSLEPIAKLLHDRQKPLLVDEAHGAHFGFHPALPKAALSYGADAVVQSTHKLLTAMTMGAMLHVQGERIDRKEIKRYLTMLQSSSPSYPLMASLDLSRMQMHTKGEELLQQGMSVVGQFKEHMKTQSRFQLQEPQAADVDGVLQDPFKVILTDAEGRMSGFALKDELEARDCFVELADPQAVLLVFSLASTSDDVDRLVGALRSIANDLQGEAGPPADLSSRLQPAQTYSAVPGLSEPVSFDEQMYRNKGTAQLPLEEAVGMMAAEMIVPYPPGIPVLCPGESISAEVVRYLTRLSAMGARIHGMTSGAEPMLPVLIATREQ
ncbi:aminotransferase class I/II-fold pyridoxal phosphate-dependent enzyme [Paenibacillus piri]|uniref:Aminotransferase class I/II-fold pyridoxal phosphate-dependent enzyme n=1 Tax=Paenibacillus piri TaxID=2547395 RepID=A0A4R5KAW2_9BACL|nr:aminotransferase class I/II-fold pyridoxal phosphate-dependent enzyme [Paenibacillus piri]TDF91618.1 aminotransferase class I/II-fold pyridoxal phosphate-dependent enzyme [Paenibacillus piri]